MPAGLPKLCCVAPRRSEAMGSIEAAKCPVRTGGESERNHTRFSYPTPLTPGFIKNAKVGGAPVENLLIPGDNA